MSVYLLKILPLPNAALSTATHCARSISTNRMADSRLVITVASQNIFILAYCMKVRIGFCVMIVI